MPPMFPKTPRKNNFSLIINYILRIKIVSLIYSIRIYFCFFKEISQKSAIFVSIFCFTTKFFTRKNYEY